MKAKIYVGAKKYALYIGRKIIQKTLEFLTLPARFISKKVQELKNLTMWGQSVQNGTPTPTNPIEIESVGDRTINLANQNATINYPYTYYGYSINLSTYSLQIKLKEGKIIPAGAYFGIVRRDTNNKNSAKWVLTNGALTNNGFVTMLESEIPLYTNYGLVCYPANKATWDVVFDTFDIMLVQGTYSIQTMPPYEPYGYKVPVEVSGKNLFKNTSLTKQVQWATSITEVVNELNKLNTGTYTLSCEFELVARKDTTDASVYGFYSTNNTPIIDTRRRWQTANVGTIVRHSITFNITDTTKGNFSNSNLFVYGCGINGVGASGTVILRNFQIEQGTQATSYQPYVAPTTTNIYLPEPLRKISEYADTLSVDGTNVTVVRNVGVFGTEELANAFQRDGNASSTYIGSQYVRIFSNDTQTLLTKYYFGGAYASRNNRFNVLCTKLVPLNTDFSLSTYKYGMVGIDSSLNLFIDTTKPANTTEMAQRIRDLGLKLVLPLNTPTTETYTIEQPINLPQGTLSLDTDTKIKPSKINITGDIDNE